MRRAIALAVLLVLLVASPAAALSVTQTLQVGLHPFGVAQTPDGHLYVSNNGSNTISVVDPATATSTTVSPTITVGRGPGEIAIDPLANRAYVGNFLDSTVSVIDIAAGVVVQTLSPGGLGVAVDPALGRLYATSGPRLTVYDTATLLPVDTLIAPPGSGYWGVALDTVRHRGYVGDLGGTGVVVIDLLTNSVLTTVPVGGKVRFALAADAASGRVYVGTDSVDGSFVVIDADTNTVLNTVHLGLFPSHIVASDRVYVTESTQFSTDVATVDPSTLVVRRYPINMTAPLGGPKASGFALVGPNVYVALNGLSVLVVMAESAPVVSVTVSPSAATTSDTLTATVSASDADNDPLTVTYQWMKNGVPLADATALTLDLSVAGNGDHGDSLALRVTANDGTHTTTATSQAVVVADTAPVVDSASIAPATASTDSVLTATATGHDADADALTFAYQWTKNGTDIAGAMSSTLDLSAYGNGDRGDTIAVRVTASDGQLVSTPVTSAGVLVVNAAPVTSVSLNTTTPTTRVMLVATVTASDADADPLTFTYVWTVDGVVRQTTLTTSTTDSFDLSRPGNGNHGDAISVDVTASDGTSTASASASATVVGGKPITP